MARNFNGTSDIAYVPSLPLGGNADFAISAWLYRADNTQSNRLLFEYGPSGNGFDLVANGAGGVDLIRSYTPNWSDTYVPPAAGAWHHYLWVIGQNGPGSPNSVNIVYIDGTSQTLTSAGHSYPAGVDATNDFTIMGRRSGGVNSNFLGGKIAEFAMWSSPTIRANPAPWAKTLAAGTCPLRVRRDEMNMYLPFLGENPEPDWHGAQRSATITGTTVINHPATLQSMVAFSG